MSSWYISDQYTADSTFVSEGPASIDTSFALIPSQTQYAQCYLNQNVPVCGSYPLPELVYRIHFQYMFTGASTGCSIAASVVQGGPNLVSISQTGHTDGVWYTYDGPAVTVQETYSMLFTIKLACESNTAKENAVLVTDIKEFN